MTDTITAPVDARSRAIQDSGAEERFVFFQPRNPVMWIYLWATAAGVSHAIAVYQPGLNTYGGALLGGSLGFALYTLLWIAFLRSLDRFTPLPAKLLATGFIWGAVASTTFLALTVNSALLTLYAKWFGTAWASDWSAGATAPFTEETIKAIGFVLLLGWAPRMFRSAFDGFVAGAFIGLGFEVSEDVLYVFQGAQDQFGTNQATLAIRITAIRALSGVVSHALFTALVCTGIMWILGRDPRGRKPAKGLGLIVLALLLHGGWDSTGAIGSILTDGGTAIAVLLPVMVVIGVLAVIWVGGDASRSDRMWAANILAPEVDSGVLTHAEAEALAGTRRDRRRFLKDVQHHGARRSAKHLLEAGRDLCAAIGRSGGSDSPDVQTARHEIARLRHSPSFPISRP